VIPPTLDTVYGVLGQNITREDVRLFLDMNVTKAEVSLAGLLIGSGKAEVQASIDVRAEMRVISSDRIRAVIEGENAYNISAENATWLSELYLPAEVFRATVAAEVVAAFQKDQELALAEMLSDMVPELDVISLDIAWKNVHPFQALTDLSLTEPPIVIEAHAVVQYLRVESIASLLAAYNDRDPGSDGKSDYTKQLKGENGDPLRTREFYSAAAYTQLLNMSMQPGWSLDVTLRVPRGFSFEYANQEVERVNSRELSFRIDENSGSAEEQTVLLASITHRRAVALALFGGLMIAGLVLHAPLGWLYGKFRIEPSSRKEQERLEQAAAQRAIQRAIEAKRKNK
ncbi:MAG: hypothetical protein ACPHK8_06360, partial [Thermoplasmatota archaeon]